MSIDVLRICCGKCNRVLVDFKLPIPITSVAAATRPFLRSVCCKAKTFIPIGPHVMAPDTNPEGIVPPPVKAKR